MHELWQILNIAAFITASARALYDPDRAIRAWKNVGDHLLEARKEGLTALALVILAMLFWCWACPGIVLFFLLVAIGPTDVLESE